MKKLFLSAIAFVLLVMTGSVVANADEAIVPYGQFSNQTWQAKYFYALNSEAGPAADWYAEEFDDSQWETIQGPISFTEQWESYPPLSFIGTTWKAEKSSYWVRRHFTVSELNHDGYVFYAAHDDKCTAYLNGVQIYTSNSATKQPNYNTVLLEGNALKALKKGENVLSVYVNDTGGGMALMDFGLYGRDLSDAVIKNDVPVKFTNDGDYPWAVNGLGEAVTTNNVVANSTSTIMMQYSSTYRTELMFDWYSYNYSQHQPLEIYIDGVLAGTYSGGWQTVRFYIEAGDHVITFHDAIGNYQRADNRSALRNIKVREIPPLETAVLTANSLPIQFVNNDTYPWTIEDGYIQSGNYGYNNTTSRITTTFTVDKTSKLTFLYRSMQPNGNAGNGSYHQTKFIVNGVLWDYAYNRQAFDNRMTFGLEPGEYTVEIVDSVWNTGTAYVSQLKDVELSNNWIDVELAYAGTLGYEALYSGQADVLADVEFLKVTGPMNAEDWTDIKNMTNLIALDLSGAQITEVPDYAFDGKTLINSVILPEGFTRIGEYAFRGTNIRSIVIPSTVKTIGKNAFISTPLTDVTFADDSQLETINRYAFQDLKVLQSVDFGNMSKLKTIGYGAFADCGQLKEFIMPNSVTELGYYMFNNNTSMKKVHFSDALTDVPDMACRNCTALVDVHLPANAEIIHRNAFESCTAMREIDIPETVKEIHFQAFYNCGLESVKLPIKLAILGHQTFQASKNLKHAEMPSFVNSESYSYVSSYNYWGEDSHKWGNASSGLDNVFQDCPTIEEIVMRSATPPAVRNDIVTNANAKKNITLIVPSFSVVNYKLDTYWYQFGTITEGDDVDYWRLTSPLMLTNNRRMSGKPDVDLYYGGQLTVGGSAPMPMAQFDMYVNETNPGRFVNTCEQMTADGVTTKFAVDANKWYFFTPLYDVTIADITFSNDASYVFRYYDAQNRAVNGASGSWKNVDTEKLIGGQGYIFHCNKACEITFPADEAAKTKLFGTTDVTLPLVVNESTSTANRSWNYVGNPFPCYYDIYYMDFTAPITIWNGSSYKAYSIADDEFVLRPMQSFFVQKPDAVDQIAFRKEGRQLTTSIAAHAARARSVGQTTRFLFNLSLSNGEQQDETRVVINNEASLDYEIGCDAAKFMSFEADVPQLYTIDDEDNGYAINERPMGDGRVPLAYYAGKAASYTIKADRADGQVFLYDAEEDLTVDLTEKDYTFQSDATDGVDASRFVLTFKMIDDEATEIVAVEDENGEIDNAIYDLQGRKVEVPQKGIFIQQGRKVVYY